jgi:hypothetical protein
MTHEARVRWRRAVAVVLSLATAALAGAIGVALGSGCAPSSSALRSKSDLGSQVEIRFDARAPGYQFGEVRLTFDQEAHVDADPAGAPTVQSLAGGAHRLDAELEWKGGGSVSRTQRTVRFSTAPGCRARIAVVLEAGLSGDGAEVRLEPQSCLPVGATAAAR